MKNPVFSMNTGFFLCCFRKVETALRKVKRELIDAKGRGDDEEYTTKAVRYRRLNEEYEAFSKAAGLRPQRPERQIVHTESLSKGLTGCMIQGARTETLMRISGIFPSGAGFRTSIPMK